MGMSESIALLVGVITCVIGVLTFVSAMMQRSKNDGVLSNKVDTALNGIDEIKKTLSEQRSSAEAMRVLNAEQQQQINTLFNKVGTLERHVGIKG